MTKDNSHIKTEKILVYVILEAFKVIKIMGLYEYKEVLLFDKISGDFFMTE
jgi:hypothetical protein